MNKRIRRRIKLFDILAETRFKDIREESELKRKKLNSTLEFEKIKFHRQISKLEERTLDEDSTDIDELLDKMFG